MHQSDTLGLLRDVVTFLASLGEMELAEPLEHRRVDLLAKSRELLLSRGGDSPEPYLDMSIGGKGGGSSSSCASSSNVLAEDETAASRAAREYANNDVSSELQRKRQQRSSLQHYYETFQDLSGMFKSINNNNNNNNNNEKEAAKKTSIAGSIKPDELDDEVSLYAGYTASQARDKATKHGPLLHLRRERNMFAPFNVFWLNRSCWVCLCGTHLLLFANERGSRPYLVAPLRGYKSRAAPDAIPRDPRRSEAAFEVYCPGDRTFRFSAKSVAEMRDWVDRISSCLDSSGGNRANDGDDREAEGTTTTTTGGASGSFRSRAATFGELLELDVNERACMEMFKEEREKYQDVNLPPAKSKSRDVDVTTTNGPEVVATTAAAAAPPLPARSQVRRLPSLPASPLPDQNDQSEELYDDEGLYHRIEDVRAQNYQNVQPRLAKMKIRKGAANDEAVETAAGETYDDVQSSTPYDDVKSPNGKEVKPTNSSPKPRSPLKRFFSDRMIGTIGRKDSSKRDSSSSSASKNSSSLHNNATKSSASPSSSMPPSPVTTSRPATTTGSCFELPSYDDVSSILDKGQNGGAVDEENYLCPPPPRPIYSRPATIVKCATRDDDDGDDDDDDDDDEIYDDIGCARVVINNGESACVDLVRQYPKNSSFLSDLQPSFGDQEHYQVPKSHNRRVDTAEQQQQQQQRRHDNRPEELYDDVSLSENFKNRSRDPTTPKSTTTTSAWSTFSSGKKARVFERASSPICRDITDNTAPEQQQHVAAKVKPLQKFINKMENTLSKVNKTSGYA